MKELWIDLLVSWGLAWWVEISTKSPDCAYYFGPFANARDAKANESGYVEDLEREGARGIAAVVKRCKPDKLTVFDESAELRFSQLTTAPSLSK